MKKDGLKTALDWRVINSQLSEDQRLQLKQCRLEAEIESTNEVAMQLFCKQSCLPAVCFAEGQTQGRGRSGRNWVSPQSENIYMSLAWGFNMGIEALQPLSLAVAIVVAEFLKAYGVKADVKWPNDIFVSGKKLAGVLLESHIKQGEPINIVIGVGLNVAMSKASSTAIDQLWTDMLEEINMNRDLDRSVMAGELLSALMQLCSDYQKNGFEFYRKKWAEYDMCAGHDVQVIAENDHYNGVCMGINNKGALRVMVDGAEQIFYAAEVSVRVQASKNAVN